MTDDKTVPINSLISRFDSQGLWFLLLCCQLIFAISHIIKSLFLADKSHGFYLLSLVCASIAYAIVLWKSYGYVRLSWDYWSLLIVNESFAYMLLSLIFTTSVRPSQILILIPFSVYSCFHIANYTRTMLLKHPYVKYKVSSVTTISTWSQSLAAFETFVQKEMLRNVAILEIMMLPSLFLGWLILGQANFVGLLALFQFIRIRFAVSPNMQWAFTHIRDVGDALTTSARCPVAISKTWNTISDWMTRWSTSDRLILALRTQMQQHRRRESSRG